ncbi:MAG TPA: PAS domain S-box protein, partial [Candidatus Thermoplasmatota archaeon]|nr:PAS domain S-box protein [Candidatus Thermoplasmatota archaeon]
MGLEDEAVREKVSTAERVISSVRVAVIVLNSLVYLFFMDHAGTYPPLAYAIIAIASTYCVAVAALQPQRRFPVLATSYFTSITDSILITLWILATGGFESPFYVLWYASLSAVAFRYTFWATVRVSAVYMALYLGLLFAMGEATGHAAEILVRIGYLPIVGLLAGLLAEEATNQTVSKVAMQDSLALSRTSEARFRGLLESAPDPIVITDREGRIVMVNQQTEKIFGYAREELLGEAVEILIPERYRSRHVGHREAYGDAPTRRPMGAGRELFGRRKDGTEFPAEISLSPMESEEGVLITSVIRDITERKQAEEDRITSRERLREIERLKEINTLKTVFLNTAAHELGTPLTPIKLQIHLLKQSPPGELGDRQRRAINVLDRNVERLVQLVEEVLEVSRLQAGRLGVNRVAVDLNHLVNEAVESFQALARKSEIDLEAETEPDTIVNADPKRITQVLFNLLSNACKFTPPGGRIVVKVTREGSHAAVRVIDTGSGIPEDKLPLLFQAFTQVHDISKKAQGGTGLGLYISKGIIDLHDGQIWAESAGPY